MNWQKKRILVTGAAGFIGSHLVRRLLREGSHVIILYPPGIVPRRLGNLPDSVTVVEVDLRDLKKLQHSLPDLNPQVVFHLAALVDVARSWDLVGIMIENNLIGTLNLLTALKDNKPETFVNFASSEEYGTQTSPLSETMREMPTSPYSFSKTATVFLCQMATRIFDFNIINLRLFPTYGPGQESSMLIPSAISHLLKEGVFSMSHGEQLREFNYIDDVIEAILRAAACKSLYGDIVNIGNGEPVQVKTVVEIIQNLINHDTTVHRGACSLRKGEGGSSFCENNKIRLLTDWSPKVSLNSGLQITVEWFKKHLVE